MYKYVKSCKDIKVMLKKVRRHIGYTAKSAISTYLREAGVADDSEAAVLVEKVFNSKADKAQRQKQELVIDPAEL